MNWVIVTLKFFFTTTCEYNFTPWLPSSRSIKLTIKLAHACYVSP